MGLTLRLARLPREGRRKWRESSALGRVNDSGLMEMSYEVTESSDEAIKMGEVATKG